MNYNEFKQSVVENFSSYLSERYQSAEVVVKPTNKVNRQVDGIVLMNIDGLPNASPTIYVNDMYEQYLETENFDEVMEKAAGTMEHAIEEFPEVARIGVMDFDSLKDNVVLTLINAESNKELLKTVPHRTFEDLAIVYRWYLKHDDQGIYSNLVNNDLAERVGMTEEQLYKAAVENTSRIFPPTVRNMNEVITEMIFGDDIMDLEMKKNLMALLMKFQMTEAYLLSQMKQRFTEQLQFLMMTDFMNYQKSLVQICIFFHQVFMSVSQYLLTMVVQKNWQRWYTKSIWLKLMWQTDCLIRFITMTVMKEN